MADKFDIRTQCKWCGREKENNPGDYYHEAQCHSADVSRRINEGGSTPALEAELERARYVGD